MFCRGRTYEIQRDPQSMVTNNIGPIRLSSAKHKVHKQGIKLFDFQILNFYMGIIDVILN